MSNRSIVDQIELHPPSCLDKSWLVARNRNLCLPTTSASNLSQSTASKRSGKLSKKDRKISEKVRLEAELVQLRGMIKEERINVARLEEQVGRLYSQRRHLYQKAKFLQDELSAKENRLRHMQALLCEERTESAERLRQAEAEKAAVILDIERSRHKNEAHMAQLSTGVMSTLLAYRTLSDDYKVLLERLEEEEKLNQTLKKLYIKQLEDQTMYNLSRTNSIESFTEQTAPRLACASEVEDDAETCQCSSSLKKLKKNLKDDEGYGSLLVQFEQMKKATSDSILLSSLESSPPSPTNMTPTDRFSSL
ncbi:DgyrCDS11596 [Dimorphilus gyrociliatus]|uniref:DgyrCDS11596 n=1 Tax=Dimorphilus gyrociliatus TaxID=2664684 RepID=A0A7I8W5Q3_9ANNE|nr:DgyrCDS11596 [Dimorphilus gyrociliatus]